MTRHMRLATAAAFAAAALAPLAGAAAHAQGDEQDAPVSGDIHIAPGLDLRGRLDGKQFDVRANVLALQPHGGDERLQVYCIDIRTDLEDKRPYTEGDWDESGVANLEAVRWVLSYGYPNVGAEDLLAAAGAAPAADWDRADTERVAYAATQAAVWHFTDGFEFYDENDEDYDPDHHRPVIGGTDAQNDAVTAVYEILTDNAGRLPDPSEFYVDLDGADDAEYDQGRFGPYTIRSNAGPVAMNADGGRLVDADGQGVDTLEDGEDFYIVLDEGSQEIHIGARGTYDLPVGRVFLPTTDESLAADAVNPLRSGGSQKLILAQPREGEVPAEWAFALEAPEQDRTDEAGRRQLPATGASLTAAFAVGLALLIGGLTVTALARRRAAE